MATLLLAVNEPTQASTITALLEEHGHSVVVEYAGRSALARLELDSVDALICDEALPGMLGCQLIEAARRNLGRPCLPAVVISSLPAKFRADVAVPEHVIVLATPVDPTEIGRAISRFRLAAPGQERRRDYVTSAGYRRRWTDKLV